MKKTIVTENAFRPTTDLNLGGLIEAVAEETGRSRADADLHVRAVLDVVARTMTAGYAVRVSNFGTFKTVLTPARFARNPQTGERVLVPARFRPVLGFVGKLKAAVYAGQLLDSITKDPKSY